MTPDLARRTWRIAEPIHAMIYFVPEAAARYAEIGITHPRMGYFASRAAAMGAVGAEVVIATFFNFNPELVRRAIPAAWTITTPERVIEARFSAVDDALRRAWTDKILTSDSLARAAELAQRAAEAATTMVEGRPLFAGHADQPWPDEPHLVLWHAQSLLREFRGDGHIAALVNEGLTGIEALITHAAAGDVPAAALIATRAWSGEEWAAGVAGLVERGVIVPGEDLAFTDEGRIMRQRIEDTTDRLAMFPYQLLGDDACATFTELVRPLSKAVVEGGLLVPDLQRLLGD